MRAESSGAIRVSSTIPNAIPGNSQPTAMSAPKMLENQCGSSDMIQSMAANVTVSP